MYNLEILKDVYLIFNVFCFYGVEKSREESFKLKITLFKKQQFIEYNTHAFLI